MSARERLVAALRLVGYAALFWLAAFAISRALKPTSTGDVNFVVWLLLGAILHDAIALPLYTVADKLVRFATGDNVLRRVHVTNHIRIPAAVSLSLFLVYFPTILDKNPGNFARVSGREQATNPAQAWLWITVGIFAFSALLFVARELRARGGAATSDQV